MIDSQERTDLSETYVSGDTIPSPYGQEVTRHPLVNNMSSAIVGVMGVSTVQKFVTASIFKYVDNEPKEDN